MNSERLRSSAPALKSAKRPISDTTTAWESGLDIVPPIRGEDIANFSSWVTLNGFSERHKAFDLAAFLTNDGKCVLGLDEHTPVRAIADGEVISVAYPAGGGYATMVYIQHSLLDSCVVPDGLVSLYVHVTPLVEDGQRVKQGEVIATLHKDEGSENGRLVHLHLELLYPKNVFSMGHSDPLESIPELRGPVADPQGSIAFRVDGREIEIIKANFDILRVNDQVG